MELGGGPWPPILEEKNNNYIYIYIYRERERERERERGIFFTILYLGPLFQKKKNIWVPSPIILHRFHCNSI